MTLQTSSATVCPYCEQPLASYSGRMECPHCARPVFGVACPKCARPTMNLTLLKRYGKVNCFVCRYELDKLPEEGPLQPSLPLHPAVPVAAPPATPPRPKPASRSAKSPVVPSLEDLRAVIEQNLHGLERAVMDREMLRTPELRAVAMRYLDLVQEALMLDTVMSAGEVTDAWLHDEDYLQQVAHLCYQPLWPQDGILLPPVVQLWALAVDDAARRWQYLRRVWLEEQCGLTPMPTVSGITAINPAWHDTTGNGPIVLETLSPGFLLNGQLLRKARVRA